MLFYTCDHCGNLVTFMTGKRVTPVCCGEPMHELTPHTAESGKEKHLPVVSVEGDDVKVSVGAVAHPMMKEHYIHFVILETDKGFLKHEFKPGEEPVWTFKKTFFEKPVAVYEYCNLHGLWKTEI